jgi:hypothetical protein
VGGFGVAAAVANVRASLRALRRASPSERALRTAAIGDLAIRIPILAWLLVSEGGAALFAFYGLRHPIHLDFSNVASAVLVGVVFAAAVGGPALHAVLLWRIRRRTLADLNHEEYP